MASRKKSRGRKAAEKVDEPIGIEELDRVHGLQDVSLQDYINAVSAYVLGHRQIPKGRKKAAQIRLSNQLARALDGELKRRLPELKGVEVKETKVAGGLRTVNADLSQSDKLDGLRLAVEIKPVNLAVGRAIWNRFGDLRAFAVNIHLKFPFCIVGGVLVIPTVEETGTTESKEAEKVEEVLATEEGADAVQELKAEADVRSDPTAPESSESAIQYKDTRHLIRLAIRRLVRARGRKTEADAAHQLEAIAVIVYDPRTATIDSELPASETGLTWRNFVEELALNYEARFE